MSRPWTVLAACSLAALPTAAAPESAAASWSYLAGLGLIVAALWYGARTARPGPARRGWSWIAAAASLWLVGDGVARITAALAPGGQADGPSAADVFWLGSYPMLVVGVLRMIHGRGLRPDVRRDIRQDVSVVTVAGAVGAWQLMVHPSLTGGGLGLGTLLAVAYPLGDVAILAMAFTLLLAPGERGPAGGLLITCFGSTFLVDGVISGVSVVAPGFETARLDAALLVANACLAAAALHPGRSALAAPPPDARGPVRMHRWRVVLLGVALVTTSVAASLPTRSALVDDVVMLAAATAVSGTILARFYRVVRERESAESLLIHQAHHDQLTGLANRSLLLDRLGAELLASDGPTTPRDLVLVYVDLDGFKAVNDRWGHAAGDEVLRTVGRRLNTATRAGDTVSRLGGDEFVVLMRDVPPEAAEAVGETLRAVVMEPIDVGADRTVLVGASVGVYAASTLDALRHDAMIDLEGLLQVADSAMYQAKSDGGGVRRAASLPGR